MVDVSRNVIALFDELITRGEAIKEACKKLYFAGSKKAIDAQSYEAWRTSCLTLLRSTFGTSSPHYDSFTSLKFFDHYNSTLLYLGILQSAREDIRKGYFYHKDLMLSVNVLSSFLQRAACMAARGEHQKAAGILEAVISEALRKLADSEGLPLEDAAGAAAAADALLRAGTLKQDSREKISGLLAFLQQDVTSAREAGSFSSWSEWVNGFVYEQLGSRIVIVN